MPPELSRHVPARRVLVVSYHAPEPDRDSGARRIFHLMILLGELGWDVSFLAADGLGDERATRALQQLGIPTFDGHHQSIESVLGETDHDLVLIAYWRNAQGYLPAIRRLAPRARVVVDSVDLHFVRDSRRILRPDGAGRLGLTLHDASLMGSELNTYAGADAVLTVSPKEASLIADLTLDPTLAWPVPDFETFPLSPVPLDQRRGMVFLGGFSHPPNVEALEWLCRDIVPLIGPRVLDAHPLRVVGSGLTPDLVALGAQPGIEMVGWVPDVAPYLDQARITVVPLLHGAGTKRKVVQALMVGTPTVMTTVGAEGLGVRDGKQALIADDAPSFARGIKRLLEDDTLWARVRRQARTSILTTNGPIVARERFRAAIDGVMARNPKRQVPLLVAGSGGVGQVEHDRRVERTRQAAGRVLPLDARILVISRGERRLLDLDGRSTTDFPQPGVTRWEGPEPATAEEVIHHLETIRSTSDADHLLLPYTVFWWLERFPRLRSHLETSTLVVHRDEASALLRWTAPVDPRLTDPGPAEPTALRGLPAPASQPVVIPVDVAEPPVERPAVRVIAFYHPEYHPSPEGDASRAEGYTPWWDVARGVPLFPGHHQPHIPADLGFTDLRLPETRQDQADLASRHGIHGFCYRHRWHDGDRPFGRPFEEVLRTGEPDAPFSLCWSVGRVPARDGRADDRAHIRWLLPALDDPRAIRVHGRSLVLIADADRLPDAGRTLDTWREEAVRHGHPGLHLVAVTRTGDAGPEPLAIGFDATLRSQPDRATLDAAGGWRDLPSPLDAHHTVRVYDRRVAFRALERAGRSAPTTYETVLAAWDDSAAGGADPLIIDGIDPDAYEAWLGRALALAARSGAPEGGLVFVGAWNAWADGAHLEPDRRHGHTLLHATRRAIAASASTHHPLLPTPTPAGRT